MRFDRLHLRALLVLFALVSTAVTAFSADYTGASQYPSATSYPYGIRLFRKCKVVGPVGAVYFVGGASNTIPAAGYRYHGGTSYAGTPYAAFVQSFYWTGNSSSNSTGILCTPGDVLNQLTLEFRSGSSTGPVLGTFGPGHNVGSVKVVYSSSGGSQVGVEIPEWVLTLDGSGGGVVTDATAPTPKAGDCLVVVNNKSGQVQTTMIGGLPVELQPGWNQIRYQGPVDPVTGFPFLGDIPFVGKTGPDGIKYAFTEYSTFSFSETNQTGFTAPDSGISISGQSSTGAMLIIPGTNGGPTTLVGLQPVTPQPLNNTSTTTPTLSNPNTTPPPTPTAPPSSTSSPVSGSSSGSGTSSGGSPVAAAGSAGEGGFYNAPSLGDVLTEGGNQASQMKDAIGSTADGLKSRTWKWWTIGEASIGQDSSWMNTQVVIAGASHKLVNVDPTWIAWLRSLILVAIKVGFVWRVIKLFLK